MLLYLQNVIRSMGFCNIFDSDPNVSYITLLSTQSTPFFSFVVNKRK